MRLFVYHRLGFVWHRLWHSRILGRRKRVQRHSTFFLLRIATPVDGIVYIVIAMGGGGRGEASPPNSQASSPKRGH